MSKFLNFDWKSPQVFSNFTKKHTEMDKKMKNLSFAQKKLSLNVNSEEYKRIQMKIVKKVEEQIKNKKYVKVKKSSRKQKKVKKDKKKLLYLFENNEKTKNEVKKALKNSVKYTSKFDKSILFKYSTGSPKKISHKKKKSKIINFRPSLFSSKNTSVPNNNYKSKERNFNKHLYFTEKFSISNIYSNNPKYVDTQFRNAKFYNSPCKFSSNRGNDTSSTTHYSVRNSKNLTDMNFSDCRSQDKKIFHIKKNNLLDNENKFNKSKFIDYLGNEDIEKKIENLEIEFEKIVFENFSEQKKELFLKKVKDMDVFDKFMYIKFNLKKLHKNQEEILKKNEIKESKVNENNLGITKHLEEKEKNMNKDIKNEQTELDLEERNEILSIEENEIEKINSNYKIIEEREKTNGNELDQNIKLDEENIEKINSVYSLLNDIESSLFYQDQIKVNLENKDEKKSEENIEKINSVYSLLNDIESSLFYQDKIKVNLEIKDGKSNVNENKNLFTKNKNINDKEVIFKNEENNQLIDRKIYNFKEENIEAINFFKNNNDRKVLNVQKEIVIPIEDKIQKETEKKFENEDKKKIIVLNEKIENTVENINQDKKKIIVLNKQENIVESINKNKRIILLNEKIENNVINVKIDNSITSENKKVNFFKVIKKKENFYNKNLEENSVEKLVERKMKLEEIQKSITNEQNKIKLEKKILTKLKDDLRLEKIQAENMKRKFREKNSLKRSSFKQRINLENYYDKKIISLDRKTQRFSITNLSPGTESLKKSKYSYSKSKLFGKSQKENNLKKKLFYGSEKKKYYGSEKKMGFFNDYKSKNFPLGDKMSILNKAKKGKNFKLKISICDYEKYKQILKV